MRFNTYKTELYSVICHTLWLQFLYQYIKNGNLGSSETISLDDVWRNVYKLVAQKIQIQSKDERGSAQMGYMKNEPKKEDKQLHRV